VLALLAQGHGIGAVADRLGITVRAARLLLAQALTDLDARNITHAVALSIAGGLLPHDIATRLGDPHVR
jgi:DNA-binding CsgD family transcriptional regulator